MVWGYGACGGWVCESGCAADDGGGGVDGVGGEAVDGAADESLRR